MKIFIMNGYALSGKDTFVALVQKIADENLIKIQKTSIIDNIKVLATQLGWEGSKTEKDRNFLSALKDLTTNYNDYSFTQICKYIENSQKICEAVFIDMREPKDIERIKRMYPVKTVFIKRDNSLKNISNHADRDVEKISYDIIIDNNGTLKDLSKLANDFYKKYICD